VDATLLALLGLTAVTMPLLLFAVIPGLVIAALARARD
jgi:hypothetical protein